MATGRWPTVVLVAAAFVAGFAVRGATVAPAVQAQTANRVFEMRTYTAPPGKLDALKARFRDHTVGIFSRLGITNIGYWQPIDSPLSENTLIYILAYPSREAAQKAWATFRTDPEWVKARTASEANGPLTTNVASVFLNPVDFSPIK
jgi:NIPSNAP protein